MIADHLSKLAIAHNSHVLPINDDFPKESLMLLEKAPWYAHIANCLVAGDSNKRLNDECRLSCGYKGLVVRPMENGFDVSMHGS